jgi:geranylgeranyl pyrophosphate synthase
MVLVAPSEPLGEALEGLIEAMWYTLGGGGKRVRALLAMATAEAVGGRAKDAIPAAMAVEMIHAYSLIHDDLPALDDDDTRRGRPSSHVAHGEALAILAGDALQALAFETLAASPKGPEESGRILAAIKFLASAVGPGGMVGGQHLDLLLEGGDFEAEDVLSMEVLKTGNLISAAIVCGALFGGARVDDALALRDAGLMAGLAFQIKDDILNHSGDPVLMGKSVGTDAARGKASYVALLGPEAAARRAENFMNKALAALAHLNSPILEGLIASLVRRDR